MTQQAFIFLFNAILLAFAMANCSEQSILRGNCPFSTSIGVKPLSTPWGRFVYRLVSSPTEKLNIFRIEIDQYHFCNIKHCSSFNLMAILTNTILLFPFILSVYEIYPMYNVHIFSVGEDTNRQQNFITKFVQISGIDLDKIDETIKEELKR